MKASTSTAPGQGTAESERGHAELGIERSVSKSQKTHATPRGRSVGRRERERHTHHTGHMLAWDASAQLLWCGLRRRRTGRATVSDKRVQVPARPGHVVVKAIARTLATALWWCLAGVGLARRTTPSLWCCFFTYRSDWRSSSDEGSRVAGRGALPGRRETIPW